MYGFGAIANPYCCSRLPDRRRLAARFQKGSLSLEENPPQTERPVQDDFL
jgi:hypothetical protein